MKAPGSQMLKVCSILFIVFGAIAAVASLIIFLVAVVFTGAVASVTDSSVATAISGVFILGSLLLVVASAAELVVGIIGVKKSPDPKQFNFFIVSGIILCVLELVSMISNFSVFSLIGFVLPVLYIIGGFQNKNAVAAPAAPSDPAAPQA